METRVSRLELLLERIEKTSQGRASSEASERQVAKAAVSTLVRISQPSVGCLYSVGAEAFCGRGQEQRMERLESMVAAQSESRLEGRLARVRTHPCLLMGWSVQR